MKFRHRIPISLIGLGLLLSACEGLAGEPSIVATLPARSISDTTLAQEDIAAVMTLGGEVWMGNCAECHGRNGLGTAEGAPLPDLTSYTDEQILASITNGKNDEMPAFGDDLNADELTAAMTYAKMMSLALARGMLATAEADAAESSAPAEATQVVPLPAANAILGVVAGQVTNGTIDAALPANLPVTLHVIKSEFVEEALESTTDASGEYRFENVVFDATYQYVVTAAYGDVMFVSDLVTIEPELAELNLPITVYESGALETAIQISAISAQLMVQDETMQVIEIVSFANTSDRVYFTLNPEAAISVHLHLPQNATLLSSVSNRYVLSTDGTEIYSTRPLLPGETQMMHIAYAMPYSQSALVDQILDYPVNASVEIVVATPNLSLVGGDFGEPQQITLGDTPVTSYTTQLALETGGSLRFDVSGVPTTVQATSTATPNAASVTESPLAYILIGAGISAFVMAAILTLRERLRAKPRSSTTIGDLLEQIASLESQHTAGTLKTQQYERQRSELKAQLSALMKTQ